jgi:HSP20 family protein
MTAVPVEVKKPVPAPKTPTVPDAWQTLRTEMDRLFDRVGVGFGLTPMGRMFDLATLPRWNVAMPAAPAMDITEDAAGYTMTAELPGMSEKDIEVAVRGDVLTLKGEKKLESERDDADVHLSERTYGAFTRSFTLPEGVDAGAIGAEFVNGVLTLKLPKAKAAMPETKTVAIKAAA